MEELTGTQAKDLGLVDEIGDEFVAREIAAKMVNIDPKIQSYYLEEKENLGPPQSKIIESFK